MNQLIYLDNAATTMTYPEVVEEMLPYYSENYGSISSTTSGYVIVVAALSK